MYFCNQKRRLPPSQIVFAALQNVPLWWRSHIQTADQTCTHQPFLPEVSRSTLIHDSFVLAAPLWSKSELQNFKMIRCLIAHGSVSFREHPVMWGVEVSSGHGPREVRTCLQFSDQPLVDHVIFQTGVFSMLIPNTIHVTSCWKQIKYLLQFFRFAKWNGEWGRWRASLLLYYGLLQSR